MWLILLQKEQLLKSIVRYPGFRSNGQWIKANFQIQARKAGMERREAARSVLSLACSSLTKHVLLSF